MFYVIKRSLVCNMVGLNHSMYSNFEQSLPPPTPPPKKKKKVTAFKAKTFTMKLYDILPDMLTLMNNCCKTENSCADNNPAIHEYTETMKLQENWQYNIKVKNNKINK